MPHTHTAWFANEGWDTAFAQDAAAADACGREVGVTRRHILLLIEEHTPEYWTEGFRAAIADIGLPYVLDVRIVGGVPASAATPGSSLIQSLTTAMLAVDRRLRRQSSWSPREATPQREERPSLGGTAAVHEPQRVEWSVLDLSAYDLVVSMLEATGELVGAPPILEVPLLWAEHEGRTLGGSPLAFLPLLAARKFTVGIDIRHSPVDAHAQIVLHSRCAIRSVSPTFNDELLAARVTDLMALAASALLSGLTREKQATEPEPFRPARADSDHIGWKVLLRVAARRIAASSWNESDRLQWALGYRRSLGEAVEESLEKIPESELLIPPSGTAWADPFPVHAEGRDLIFFEQENAAEGRGHIAVAELHQDGRLGQVHRVLEGPTHLSYPSVFRSGGDWFMVPESRAAAKVSLFRAVDFPYRWEWAGDLLTSPHLADATVFEHNTRWWLLACRVGQGESTFEDVVGYSAASLSGPWEQISPMPLVSDATAGRPAGSVIVTPSGLLRPAQDGSRRYGYGLALRKITELTASSYAEREYLRATPDWLPELRGTHTFNRSSTLTFIDVLRRSS